MKYATDIDDKLYTASCGGVLGPFCVVYMTDRANYQLGNSPVLTHSEMAVPPSLPSPAQALC